MVAASTARIAPDILTHPVIGRLREALVHAYGERLKRAVLFGSRARGDWHAESDWDVAVFLDPHRPGDRSALDDERYALLRELGEVVMVIDFPVERYAEATLLMDDIREEGIDFLPNRMPPAVRAAWARRKADWRGPVKEITAKELEVALRSLERAERLLDFGEASVAAREAYIAVYHAALALIHERMGRATKTHNGVKTLFHQLASAPGGIGADHAAFLSQAFEAKQVHDYSTEKEIEPEAVPAMLRRARALVDAVSADLHGRRA